MITKLYSKPIKEIPPKRMIALNRGVDAKDVISYLAGGESHINPPEAFGEEKMENGAKLLIKTIAKEKDAFIIVDSDCDGFTSSAILINYLYKVFPTWTKIHLSWGLHEGKQHGLNDYIDRLENSDYSLVI